MTRGGPSSADVFDQVERVYACAAKVDPRKPHLRKTGEGRGTWGVVRLTSVEIVPWPKALRAAAYAWCIEQDRASARRYWEQWTPPTITSSGGTFP